MTYSRKKDDSQLKKKSIAAGTSSARDTPIIWPYQTVYYTTSLSIY